MLWQIIKKSFPLIGRNRKPADLPVTNQLIQSAVAQHQAGNLQEAEHIYQSILEEQPDNPDALHLLGLVAHQTGNNEVAIDLIEKAINVAPSVADFYNNCGEAYRMLHQYDVAITRYEQALAINPDYAEAHNNLGNALNESDQPEQAIVHFEQALAINPDLVEAHNNLGNSLNELGRKEEAIAHFERALVINPDYAEAHNNLGVILQDLDRTEEVVAHFEQALTIKPDHFPAHNNMGNTFKELGLYEEAIACYEQALVINPEFADAHNNLGVALQELGRKDDAITSFEQALVINPNYAEAYNHLAMIKPMQGQVPVIEELLINPATSETDAMHYHYALGKIYIDNATFARAFEHYQHANRIRRKSITYDPQSHSDFVDRLIDFYSIKYFQKKFAYEPDSELPVFIVGMPRSGTSLVEQIISNHLQVYGAGELGAFRQIEESMTKELETSSPYPDCMSLCNDVITHKLADVYLKELSAYSQDARRITDKMPDNFLRIGLIKTLFPKAKIIHCKRSALDTCTSIFLNYFVRGSEYSFDLNDIGQYYLDYERLMDHWNNLFPADIFNMQYEELVENQEANSRLLIGHLGLEWDEKCLDFHQNKRAVKTASNLQVRQPMYKHSINRWKHYEKHLESLIEVLQHHI